MPTTNKSPLSFSHGTQRPRSKAPPPLITNGYTYALETYCNRPQPPDGGVSAPICPQWVSALFAAPTAFCPRVPDSSCLRLSDRSHSSLSARRTHGRRILHQMSQVPALIWAQRREKVFVTFECLETTDVSVTFSDGLLSLDAKSKGKVYKLENLPLFLEIEAEESKWFKNDR